MADRKDTGTTLAVGWMLMGIVFLFIGIVIWYFNKYEMMDAARWVRWFFMQLVDPFIADDKVVMVGRDGRPITFEQFEYLLYTLPKAKLTPELIGIASTIAMTPLRVLFSAVLVLMSLWVMFYGPYTHYRRRYDLSGLIRAQCHAFPYIAPFIEFDPSKQPVRPPGAPVPAELPPFAEALAPEEWIAFNTIPTLTGREIDQAAAAAAFAKQLGKPWRGWTYLAPYRQVLLAAFCLKAARKRKDGDAMLGELAKCWVNGKLNLNGKLLRQARSVLRNRDLVGNTIARCNNHAFETTAMMRALATAREEGGVLAPATFVWLRAYDRTLWYPLNNLGRQAYHMEALGALCHFKAEKMSGRPVVRPKVEGAVESLAEYMRSMRARPVPQLDYSRSKNRGIKKIQQGAK